MSGFTYLKPALASVLVFVGTKMLLVNIYKVHPLVSLGVIVTIISVAVIASIAEKRRGRPATTLQPRVSARLAIARTLGLRERPRRSESM